MTSLVQEDTFVKVMTSVSSSAEPSQHVCSLESAGLLTAVSKPSESSDPGQTH